MTELEALQKIPTPFSRRKPRAATRSLLSRVADTSVPNLSVSSPSPAPARRSACSDRRRAWRQDPAGTGARRRDETEGQSARGCAQDAAPRERRCRLVPQASHRRPLRVSGNGEAAIPSGRRSRCYEARRQRRLPDSFDLPDRRIDVERKRLDPGKGKGKSRKKTNAARRCERLVAQMNGLAALFAANKALARK